MASNLLSPHSIETGSPVNKRLSRLRSTSVGTPPDAPITHDGETSSNFVPSGTSISVSHSVGPSHIGPSATAGISTSSSVRKHVKPLLTDPLPTFVYDYAAEEKAARSSIPPEFSFPEHEVDIVETPFVRETIDPPLPELPPDAPLHLQKAFSFWTDGWSELIVPKQLVNSKSVAPEELPKHIYATNLHCEEANAGESTGPVVASSPAASSSPSSPSETEHADHLVFESVKQRTTYQARLDNRRVRIPLLKLCARDQADLPEDIAVPQVLKRANAITNAFQAPPRLTALVEPRELTFEIGDLEPIWCTIALYDIHLRRRVSENFSFSLNSFYSDKLLELSPQQVARLNKKAVFTFTPSSDLFIVLRLEKILQAPLTEIAELYGQGNACKEKTREKYKNSVVDISGRLRSYRQPFGWSISDVPLVSSPQEGFPSKLQFSPIFKQRSDVSDENFFATLASGGAASRTLGTTRKQKTLKGQLTLQLNILPEPNPLKSIARPGIRILSPSSLVLDPQMSAGSPMSSSVPASSNPNDDANLVRVNQEFAPQAIFLPHMQYYNNLYIYPQSLTYPKADSYMVRVFFLNSDQQSVVDPRNIVGLTGFYDPMNGQKSKNQLSSSVIYKGKSPSFYDEFKLELPPTLGSSHHLLFVVFRIRAKPPKKNQPANPETPIGFTYLSLLRENSFVAQDHELLLYGELPEYYLSLPTTAMRPLENGKVSLKIKLQLCSSVFSHDRSLNKALNLFSPIQEGGATGPEKLKNKQSLSSLLDVDPLLLMHHFPVVVHHLLDLVANDTSLADEAFLSLCSVCALLLGYSQETQSLLLSYVYYLFNPRYFPLTLFAALAKSWLSLMSDGACNNDNLLQFSPFFFALIFKALLYRKKRTADAVDAEQLLILYRLVLQLVYEAQERATTGVVVAKDLMHSLGLFFADLFYVIDRGFVTHLIHYVITTVSPSNHDQTLLDFKFAFIRTITQYRHWLAVNLPKPLIVDGPQLQSNFLNQHFLVSLVLTHISQAASHKEQSVRLQSISALSNMLHDHHGDPRFTTVEARARIAEVYFPYIILLSDRIHLYQSSSMAEKRGILICFLHLLHDLHPSILRRWWSMESPHRLARFSGALELAMEVFEYVGEKQMMSLMGVDQGAQISSGTKAALEHMYTSGVPSRLTPTASSMTSSPGTGPRFRAHKANTLNKNPADRFGKTSRPSGYKFDEVREMNFSHQCALIVLDVIEMFVEHCADDLLRKQTPTYELLSKIVHLYVLFLKRDQSNEFLSLYHPCLRALIHRFSDIIFLSKSTEFVSELIPALIVHCNCPATPVRTSATLTLFLIMSLNYEIVGGNVVRFSVQATKAVNQLSGDDRYLRKALGAIAKHTSGSFSLSSHRSREVAETKTDFAAQASEIIARLDTILENTRRINQHADDLEFKHDLMVKVAHTYNTVPDLRVSTLEKLARDHIKHQHWAEAAMIYIHLSALSAENLMIRHLNAVNKANSPSPDGSLRPPDEYLIHRRWPVGIRAFAAAISPNITEEVLPLDIVLRDTDSVCENPVFNAVTGFLQSMHEAIKHFHAGTLWESVFKTSKLLLPIYEHDRCFKEMASIFADLKKCFAQISSDAEARTRTLGVFYRVVFVGEIFGEDSGVEYVYKMPQLTRLGEIKERLEQVNKARHGADNIEIWPRNEPIPADKLKPGKGWIQLTSVRPYFDAEEIATSRVTYYEQSTNICQFIYETAFTIGSGKHAESLADQWKRQTIITTEKQFPYIKTRLRVIKSSVIELSPIQGSIDTIEQQTSELLSELRATEHNVKNLQRLLQGSLLVQVQAGPKAIALAFFDPKVANTSDAALLDSLKQAFCRFLKACREAVSLNRLVSPESTVLQEELEAAFTTFEQSLADLGIIELQRRRLAKVEQSNSISLAPSSSSTP